MHKIVFPDFVSKVVPLAAGLALLVTAGAAFAHSDGMDDMPGMAHDAHAHTQAVSTHYGAPAPADQAKRTVKIVMGDMNFEPATLMVRPHEVVKFVVTNTSSVDHEFTLGDAAEQKAHRQEMLKLMQAGQSMEHAHANAISVKPGETKELTWKFAGPGKVEYDCNVPGHYESGMKGVVTVR